MKTQITCIKIKLGDREIELTGEEARLLHEQLDLLMGKQIQYIPYHAPIYIDRTLWPSWPKQWEITCGGIGDTGSMNIPSNTLSMSINP